MKKSQLSDKQLEELLRDMPKVKDHRDPRDIYLNIAHRSEKRRLPAWLYPAITAVAVILLAFILTPGMLDLNQPENQSMDSESIEHQEAKVGQTGDEKAAFDKVSIKSDNDESENDSLELTDEKEQETERFMAEEDIADPYADLTALYPGEIEGKRVITYAIPDANVQTLVPVTVAMPSVESKTWIDTFMDTMGLLKEKEWGLSEFYPIDAEITYDQASLVMKMDFKQSHPYKNGSVSSDMLLRGMEQSLAGQGVAKLTFTTEGKPGVDLGNFGNIEEHKIPQQKRGRAFLFLYPKGADQPYLVPTKEAFNSIEPAFEQMTKSVASLNLRPSLPQNFEPAKIEADQENKVIKINLNDGMEVNDGFKPALEAILLTAKEFGFQEVKIDGANTKQVGPFNLDETIPVPVAPNKKNIE